jgi:Pro-kumamolisin, activation domain
MKTSLAVTFMLASAYSGLAQNNPSRSPAGEPPSNLRNGRATLVGHFSDPKQMLRLAFGLVPPHLAEEEQFLQELMTPGSPQFRRFLTPEQWNARFAPTVEDEQAVVDWATSQGLTITHRFPNRLIVDVEAPVATIENALQVRINSYRLDGYTYFSNEREPVIPARLSGVIRSVGGLHNFPQMHPASFRGPMPPGALYNPGPVVGVGQAYQANGNRAKFEAARAGSRQSDVANLTNGKFDPTDIYSSNGYDYAALQNQGHCCNPNHVAGGAPPESSIALATFGNLHVGMSPNVFPDVVAFQAQYPYLALNITSVPVDGGPSTCVVAPMQPCSNDLETALDTEWSAATSNSMGSYLDTAQIWVYEGGGSAEDVYNQMLSDGHAKIFSTSWSCTEISGCSGSEMDMRHSIFNMMTGVGWTLMTASGDRGATDDCSTTSVSYPAVDPNVVGVGGTLHQVYTDGSFDSEVAWTGGTTAKSCKNNNGGSGGGCSVHYGVPGFQSGSNGTCGTQRSVPDIALNAAAGQNMYFNGSLFGIGGTSISSPMLAGFFAQEGAYLLYVASITGNDCGSPHQACTPMGNGSAFLYQFGQNPTYAPHYPFYDITSGCNSNDITAGPPALTFFCAGVGYDSVTGWGTANMLQLAWAINTFIAGDFGAPAVTFSGPETSGACPGVGCIWYKTPQTVSWSIAATSANGAVPNGVAGFSQAWDADPGDVLREATPGSGNSFYSGPQFPNLGIGSLVLNSSLEGCHTAWVRAWDNGGTGGAATGRFCYDDIPPVVHCASPDGLWHANNVSLACTSSDSISGLAIPSEASFSLMTDVLAGFESPAAVTNSLSVCDVAGNCTTAGPIGPNMVDRTNPVITITQPTATNYTHSSTLTLNYTVTDTGSGVGTVTPTMNGSTTVGGSTITNGLAINLLTALPLGPNTFAITAYDKVLNKSSASVTFTIIVTAASIISDVNELQASGAISMNTNPLLAKLNNALADRSRGNCNAAGNLYGAFINQVMAKTGKGITAAAAAILIADAEYLEAHCP